MSYTSVSSQDWAGDLHISNLLSVKSSKYYLFKFWNLILILINKDFSFQQNQLWIDFQFVVILTDFRLVATQTVLSLVYWTSSICKDTLWGYSTECITVCLGLWEGISRCKCTQVKTWLTYSITDACLAQFQKLWLSIVQTIRSMVNTSFGLHLWTGLVEWVSHFSSFISHDHG